MAGTIEEEMQGYIKLNFKLPDLALWLPSRMAVR